MSVYYYQAIHFILKKGVKDPKLTKREIGVWSHWKTDDPENDKPLSQKEVEKYKKIIKEKGPSTYHALFPEENEKS